MPTEEVQTKERGSNGYGRKKVKQKNEIIDNKKKNHVLTYG
jgi:hypothetical protein